jgi:hypothetical protein
MVFQFFFLSFSFFFSADSAVRRLVWELRDWLVDGVDGV